MKLKFFKSKKDIRKTLLATNVLKNEEMNHLRGGEDPPLPPPPPPPPPPIGKG